ncbi:MAG: RluA family pseudouridine synthase [Candidatus Adiutrix sp.]|nr:RluA family pseudouridine synthase [Candidatus Adiutrix sp.]
MKRRFSRDQVKARKQALGLLPPPPEEGDDDVLPLDEDPCGEAESDGKAAPGAGLASGLAPGEAVSLTVAAEESGRRLDTVLSARYPEFSRSQLARQAKEGLVTVDGRPARASAAVAAGQTVVFPVPRRPLTDMLPEPEVVLDVVFEDEHVLAVNKPWGLAVHPAPGHSGPTLAGGLLARDARLSEVGERFRPGLVHRLDKDTSGVLITARTDAALRQLSGAFSSRATVKRYLAFVRGCPKIRRGAIDGPIGRHATQRHKMAAGVPDGRPSRTLYRVLRFFPQTGVSLVLLTLVTGRTHQARVHLQSLGTPVLADPVYSRGVADLVKRFPSLEPHLQRQMLHARRLTVAHPATGQPQTFRAPWPADCLGLLRELMRLEAL